MAEQGVVCVAYGDKAVAEAGAMIASLKERHDWPVLAMADGPVAGADVVWRFDEPGWGARRAKLHQDRVVPWQKWLYLDADTRVRGDLSVGFRILDDGWDLAITASQHQEENWLWTASAEERSETERPCRLVSIQGGAFFARKSRRTSAFFEAWRQEWARWATVDQGALVRALQASPVRLWLLGRDFNGGAVVEHLFGRAVER